jgi:serine/threonine-protein kinase
MGVVYLARHTRLNRLVALKVILSGGHASQEEVQRFHAEARAAAALSHPGIVPLYEVGQWGEQQYLAMGYVEGGSLAVAIEKGPQSPDAAALLVKEVCEAVAYAHAQGVIHRDLKPANLLLDASGKPLITDFGLAKQVTAATGPGTSLPERLTRSGAILGTPSYMPPEQAAGKSKEVGPHSDVYALGAILYELLTGRPPFRAANTIDTLLQVMDVPPAPPRLLNSAVPADLEAICLKCLEKSPRHRYASALELARDLDRFLEREPVQAEASAAARLLRPWLRDSRHSDILSLHGRAWLWQAWIVFATLLATNIFLWCGYQSVFVYLALWSVGLVLWLIPAWYFVFRNRHEWSPVEKQLGHLVFLSLVTTALFALCADLTDAEPMQVLPLWLLLLSMTTGAAAIILRGTFYLLAVLCALSAVVIAVAPVVGPVVFGTAYVIGVFVPAWKNTRSKPTREAV